MALFIGCPLLEHVADQVSIAPEQLNLLDLQPLTERDNTIQDTHPIYDLEVRGKELTPGRVTLEIVKVGKMGFHLGAMEEGKIQAQPARQLKIDFTHFYHQAKATTLNRGR